MQGRSWLKRGVGAAVMAVVVSCPPLLGAQDGSAALVPGAEATPTVPRQEDPLAAPRAALLAGRDGSAVLSLHAKTLLDAGDVETLGAVLDGGGRASVLGVLSAIQVSRDTRLWSQLVGLVTHAEDDDVRTRAEETLVLLARTSADDLVPQVVEDVADPTRDRDERRVLVELLGQSGDLSAVDALINRLDGPLRAEAHAALVALTGHDPTAEADPEAWRAFWATHDHLSREALLEQALATQRTALVELLATKNREIVDLLVARLGQDVSRLVEGLESAYAAVRVEAARRLGGHPDREQVSAAAVPVLMARLDPSGENPERDPTAESAMIAALGELGRPRTDDAIPSLLILKLRSPDALVVSAAVTALSVQRQRPAIVSPLLDLLDASDILDDPRLIATVLSTVAQNMPGSVLPRLTPWLAATQPPEVRAAAVRAVLATDDLAAALDEVESVDLSVAHRTVRYDVAKGIGDRVRGMGLEPGFAGQDRIQELLSRLIGDADASVRAETAITVGEVGNSAGLSILEARAAVETDTFVQERIIEGIGELGLPDGVPVIGRICGQRLNGNAARVEGAARVAIGRIGAEGRARDWVLMGERLREVAAYGLAAWCFDEVSARFGAAPEMRDEVDEARGRHAEVLYEAHRFSEARDELLALDQGDARFPPRERRFYLLARVFEELEEYTHAADFDMQRLALVDPGAAGRSDAERNAARTLRLAGRPAEALELIDGLLGDAPADSSSNDLMLEKARCHEDLGQWAAGDAVLVRLQQRADPADTAFLAEVDEMVGRVRRAAAAAATAVSGQGDPAPPATTQGPGSTPSEEGSGPEEIGQADGGAADDTGTPR